MTSTTLIVIALVGVGLGWLADKLRWGSGAGLLADVAAGLIGAAAATWAVQKFGLRLPAGIAGTVISSAVGAGVLLVAARFYGKGVAEVTTPRPAVAPAKPAAAKAPPPPPPAPVRPERPLPRTGR